MDWGDIDAGRRPGSSGPEIWPAPPRVRLQFDGEVRGTPVAHGEVAGVGFQVFGVLGKVLDKVARLLEFEPLLITALFPGLLKAVQHTGGIMAQQG